MNKMLVYETLLQLTRREVGRSDRLKHINWRLEKLMSDSASVLAKLDANNDTLRALAADTAALREGNASLAGRWAELKQAIASLEAVQAAVEPAAPPASPDTQALADLVAALDAKFDEQSTIIADLDTKIYGPA